MPPFISVPRAGGVQKQADGAIGRRVDLAGAGDAERANIAADTDRHLLETVLLMVFPVMRRTVSLSDTL